MENVSPEIILLLCKTPTKKTLERVDLSVHLICESDDLYLPIEVCADFDSESEAKHFEGTCVNWLNY